MLQRSDYRNAFVEQAGRQRRTFLAYAIARSSRPAGLDGPVLHEATMLLLPDPASAPEPERVGPSCRTIAGRLRMPLGTVKSHVRRGLIQLRNRMEEVTGGPS